MRDRFFSAFIEAMYWLRLFLAPVFAMLFIAFLIHWNVPLPAWIWWAMLALGILLGVLFAERIRRKYGCANYVARLLGAHEGRDQGGKSNTR